MTAEIVQAQYEQLEQVANRFNRQADQSEAIVQSIRQMHDTLVGGQWQGDAARAFANEMQANVFPAFSRLIAALRASQALTIQIKTVMRQAEEEAARLFQGSPTEGVSAFRGGGTSMFANAAQFSAEETPTPAAPADPNNYDRFDKAIEYMHQEMVTNAQSDVVKQMKSLLDSAMNPKWYDMLSGSNSGDKIIAALTMWTAKVHAGSDWDHKPILGDMLGLKNDKDYYFPIRGDQTNEYYYDIWSNIHYGYVGAAAGFDTKTLQDGANLGDALTGTNDAGDVLTVQMGIDLWNKYGTSMTQDQLHAEILANRENLVKLDKTTSGKNQR
ncbi:WXG100 family type VII secretion target [Herpetosiphon llansteffanensis]|uniref:WXG100 family type VII secretion target n=1 Tax=Herpetosiphon llansteffanensis TaxID=2094568 RepID=UPI000D7C540A|nr:WXG100 family type VII secretion target [Herpetosiphon llansteffanensis]